MKKIKLGDVCKIITGKLDSNAATENGKYPFFTCAPEPLKINEFAFDDDVILLAGNNAQGNFHLTRYNGKFNAYQRTYVITANKNFNIDYVKYSIELSLNSLKKFSQGSQTKFLTLEILKNFILENIPLEEQEKKAACLVDIDQKISLNKKINAATLEEMAKTIYDYYFVQFDFPDENGKPYKSSGGKMIFSPELQREIPEGWQVKHLNEIIKIFDSQRIPLSNAERNNMKGTIPYYGATGIIDYVNKKIFDGIYLLVAEDGSTETNQGTLVLQYIWGKSWVNNHAHILQGTENYSTEYLFLALKDVKTKSLTTGSIQKKITQENLFSIKLACPKDKKLLNQFQKTLSPIFEKYRLCATENNLLENLRDFLLPMLMNGQVTFAEED